MTNKTTNIITHYRIKQQFKAFLKNHNEFKKTLSPENYKQLLKKYSTKPELMKEIKEIYEPVIGIISEKS